MKKLIFLLFFFSFSFGQPLKLEKIYIFGNKTFIYGTSLLSSSKHSTVITIPDEISLKEIYFNSDNGRCSLYHFKEIQKENPLVSRLKETLQKKELLLEEKEKKLMFLDKIPVSQKNIDILTKKFKNLQQEIKILKEEIENLRKEIKIHQRKNIEVSYSCKDNQVLELFFPVDVSAYHRYVINGSFDKGEIYIQSNLILKNNENFPLKEVSVDYFSYMKNPSVSPDGTPFISKRTAFEKAVASTTSYRETGAKSHFFVEKISISPKKSISVVVSEDKYKAKFDIFIDGYATRTPFIRALVKPDKNFPVSKGIFFLDNMYIGEEILHSLKKGKKNYIFFGEDFFTDVKKEKILDRYEYISKRKSIHIVRWKYYIKNNHKKQIDVILKDRLPVSPSENIQFEYISDLPWESLSPDGTVVWHIKLKPGQLFVFEYGYKRIKIKE